MKKENFNKKEIIFTIIVLIISVVIGFVVGKNSFDALH